MRTLLRKVTFLWAKETAKGWRKNTTKITLFSSRKFKYSDGNLVKVKHITYLGFMKRKPIPEDLEYLRIVWTTQKKGATKCKAFFNIVQKAYIHFSTTFMSENQFDCSKLVKICNWQSISWNEFAKNFPDTNIDKMFASLYEGKGCYNSPQSISNTDDQHEPFDFQTT